MPPASIADETRRHCTEPVKPHFVAPSEQIFELRHRAIHQSRAQPALTGVLVFCLEASVTRSALLLRLTRLRDFRLRDFLFEISCSRFPVEISLTPLFARGIQTRADQLVRFSYLPNLFCVMNFAAIVGLGDDQSESCLFA